MTVGSPTPPDDAQRTLEQRALRNVRDLVDKMESIEARDSRKQKRMLVGLIVGVTLVVGLILAGVVYVSHKQSGKSILIETGRPGKSAPPTSK